MVVRLCVSAAMSLKVISVVYPASTLYSTGFLQKFKFRHQGSTDISLKTTHLGKKKVKNLPLPLV